MPQCRECYHNKVQCWTDSEFNSEQGPDAGISTAALVDPCSVHCWREQHQGLELQEGNFKSLNFCLCQVKSVLLVVQIWRPSDWTVPCPQAVWVGSARSPLHSLWALIPLRLCPHIRPNAHRLPSSPPSGQPPSYLLSPPLSSLKGPVSRSLSYEINEP